MISRLCISEYLLLKEGANIPKIVSLKVLWILKSNGVFESFSENGGESSVLQGICKVSILQCNNEGSFVKAGV